MVKLTVINAMADEPELPCMRSITRTTRHFTAVRYLESASNIKGVLTEVCISIFRTLAEQVK